MHMYICIHMFIYIYIIYTGLLSIGLSLQIVLGVRAC